jgi:ASC-1-like (ASCH) protein
MDHVAIMTKSWKLIPKILSGKKTIESRWYKTKRTPWNRIRSGDHVYFKNSGEAITATADVAEVLQFTLDSIDSTRDVTSRYGKEICLIDPNPSSWPSTPKYCILIRLKNAHPIDPFLIDKRGFGNAAAWITIDSIDQIRL